MPSITEALRHSPEVATLLHQTKQQETLQTIIAGILPAAMRFQRCRIKISGNRLTLIAPDTAFSAKLRQLDPTILSRLAQQGHSFTHIRISTSKNQTITEPQALYIDKPLLSSTTRTRLTQFAQQLEHLPRAAEALRRIADHHLNEQA